MLGPAVGEPACALRLACKPVQRFKCALAQGRIIGNRLRIMAQAEITVRVDLGRGAAQASVYTCDFSYDYVKINADYRS